MRAFGFRKKITFPRGPLLAVLRLEWRQLLFSPLTYIFQLGFLIAVNVGIFIVADFYATDEASIALLVTLLPWVALIFVPALAMRMFSEGPGDRAMELTRSLPLSIWHIVLGKFLANAAVLLLTLAFTFPFVLTIAYLGNPDWGATCCGYLGLTLVLLLFLSAAEFAAALVWEPVATFIVAVAILFILLMSGWDAVSQLVQGSALAPLVDTITLLSPKHWLDRLAEGRIEIAAIVYFTTVTAAFLYGSAHLLAARERSTGALNRLSSAALKGGSAFLAIAALVTLTQQIPQQLDLTAEKEFTLHQGTIEILKRLGRDTRVDLYWTRSGAAIPASIRAHAARVTNLLQSMANHSNHRLLLRVHDATRDSDAEMRAQADGLRFIPMTSGEGFMLGATFKAAGRTVRIPYFDINRERNLEYDLAQALHNLSQTRTPKIGILSPLLAPSNLAKPPPGLSFLEEVKANYDVAIIPHFADHLPQGLDVLLVIDATILKPSMLASIDAHVTAGRSLIVLIDPYVRFHRASNQVHARPSDAINDISDLLLRYGVKYLGERVVGDAKLASRVAVGAGGEASYPYWPSLGGRQFSSSHPVIENLKSLLFIEPGALKATNAAPASPLVQTTQRSGALPIAQFARHSVAELSATFHADGRPRVLAMALRGPFASAYAQAPARQSAGSIKNASPRTGTIFVVADVDWIFDPASEQVVNAGDGRMSRPLNDNRVFLMNMLEYASGSPALVAIRSRGRLSRPFERVADVIRQSQGPYKAAEAQLIKRIALVRLKFRQILQASGVKRINQLPKTLRQRIKRLQRGLLRPRRELRQIRLKMRESAQMLGRRVMLFNMAAPPLLVIGFAALAWLARRRRRSQPHGSPDGTGIKQPSDAA